MAHKPVRVFVYGSCVSRDTLELAHAGEFNIVRYVARQSLLSMGRNAIEFWPEGFSLKSKFQNEMAREDWLGSVWWRMTQQLEKGIDLVLWDLTDERFGVYSFHDKARVTRTIDMVNTPLETVAAEHTYLPLGHPEHLRWWRWLVQLFAQRLRDAGLFEKTVVLRVPWATETETGEPTPSSMGISATEANELFAPYYEALQAEGYRIIDLSDFPVFAEPLHQWGLAPFHYTLEVYEQIIAQLREFLASAPHAPELSPASPTSPESK